ncbi:hypothetical protein [Streptomyces sp. NPDC005012]|uniref:hypothetical protein n=1 Tax=Streptomyces sp. NPDC005012 TaxID=3154558 RepID=UPI0033AE3B1C
MNTLLDHARCLPASGAGAGSGSGSGCRVTPSPATTGRALQASAVLDIVVHSDVVRAR